MKELVNAISQASANRLKQPFFGSFILGWIAVNHTLVIEFIFSKSEQKIELVKNSEFSFYSDMLFPVLLALAYTFGLPLIQHCIDKFKFRCIDLMRIKERHRTERVKYTSQRVLSKKKAEANPDYWKEKLNRDLDKWDEQRTKLLDNYREKSAELSKARQDAINTIDKLNEEIKEKEESHKAEVAKLKAEQEKSVDEIERAFQDRATELKQKYEENLAFKREKIEREHSDTKELAENLRKQNHEYMNKTSTVDGLIELLKEIEPRSERIELGKNMITITE